MPGDKDFASGHSFFLRLVKTTKRGEKMGNKTIDIALLRWYV